MSIGTGIVVRGFCPMGCGETLRLSGGGTVICFGRDCPRPTAVSELLKDNETEHIVQLDANGWMVRHPLWERIAGRLESCSLADDLNLNGPPVSNPGRYRVHRGEAGWELVPFAGVSV